MSRKQYTKHSDAQVQHINELLDKCWGTRRIAHEVGTSRQVVNYYRRKRELDRQMLAGVSAAPAQEGWCDGCSPDNCPGCGPNQERGKKSVDASRMVGRSLRASDGPKILTFDIETLPLESYTWGLFDQNVGLNQIKTDWAAMSIAAKWMHSDEVWYEDTRDKATIRDDKDLIAKLCVMLNEADIVVGQNVKKFDLRKIRARAIMHGLPPFKEPLVQDTMLMARSIGSFTSNKLEYLSANLTDTPKSKHQKFPGFELWLGVLQGNLEAWEEMREYNIQDVRATEQLYLKLRPWVRNHPNVSHYYKDDENHCPRCGSTNLYTNGTIFRGVSEYHAYTCSDCGGHSRSRYTLNSRNKRKSILTTI